MMFNTQGLFLWSSFRPLSGLVSHTALSELNQRLKQTKLPETLKEIQTLLTRGWCFLIMTRRKSCSSSEHNALLKLLSAPRWRSDELQLCLHESFPSVSRCQWFVLVFTSHLHPKVSRKLWLSSVWFAPDFRWAFTPVMRMGQSSALNLCVNQTFRYESVFRSLSRDEVEASSFTVLPEGVIFEISFRLQPLKTDNIKIMRWIGWMIFKN